MIRSAIAGLVFAVLYAVGIRLYTYLSAGRDAHRWQFMAVAAASGVGGAGFYLAQQIRSPHSPTLLDIPAFIIMGIAAGVIPALLETVRLLQIRLLRDTKIQAITRPPVPPDTPSSGL